MNKLILSLIFLGLTAGVAGAQTVPYVPQWCTAPWPPASGEHMTVGKDNGGAVCVKMGSATGFRVVHGKEGNSYYETIDADTIVIAPAYLIFKKAGKQVAWFDMGYVRGWKVNTP